MDWIKKNPAKFALIVVAVLVLASMALLAMRISSFDEAFEKKRTPPPAAGKVEKPDIGPLEETQKALATPANWQPGKDATSLFVSHLWVLKDDKLVRPDLPDSPPFHPPVPNKWLTDHGLDLLSATVLQDDPDGDGFSTLDEWLGTDGLSHLDDNGQPVLGPDGKPLPDDSTDPTDKNSHPPYYTKLQLAHVINIPFRLELKSYDLNPKNPKDVTAQINAIDRGRKTLFVPLGEDIPGTKFKTESFAHKEVPGADGTKTDASELTIINKETGEKVIMPLKTVVDSPDSHAVFRYLWAPPGGSRIQDFPIFKGKVFHLPPDLDREYRLIEIKPGETKSGEVKPGEAIVEVPGGEKRTFKETK